MKFTRRDFLQTATSSAALAAVPHLAIAKVEDGWVELRARTIEQSLYRDTPSELWSYGDEVPGPELRIMRGERLRIRVINDLPEPTSVHWHGIRIDNKMDGVAGLTQKAIEPGAVFEYDFVVPDAGTYWYHAHNKSWNQVARGLYGPLIIDEDEPVFDRDHDLTLIVDDWRLAGEGTFDDASLGSLMDWSHGGRLGNWMTVNGRSLPIYKLRAGEPYRLRLINASNARIMEIDPNRFNAEILAFDGQALPERIQLSYAPLLIGPAQRVDLTVVPEPGVNFAIEELSGDQPFPFAQFEVLGQAKAREALVKLPVKSLPEPVLTDAKLVRLHMTGGAMGNIGTVTYQGRALKGGDFGDTGQFWAFNGVANLAEEPLFSADRGETVIVETFNDTSFPHAMHVHGHHFRIVERSGSNEEDHQMWRDTFMIGPAQTTRIAFVADNPGKWLLHCHMLEHAAAGMNTWFEVV